MACKATAVRPTHKTRTFEERYDPGGGESIGPWVHEFGGDALALIMTGGVFGRLIEELRIEPLRSQALGARGNPCQLTRA